MRVRSSDFDYASDSSSVFGYAIDMSEENASEEIRSNMLPPWQVSLGYTAVGVILTLLLFLFPGLRRLHLSSGESLPTPFLVIAVPLLASGWALVGIFWKRADQNRRWSLISLGIAILTIALGFLAFWTDPLRQ